MTGATSPIPRLPPEIKDAASNKKLVVFIGAGVSQSIGCASWDELAQNLIKICFEGKNGTRCINFKEKETLSRYRDPKKIVTICRHILQRNDFEDVFIEEIKESLKPTKGFESQNIYDELRRLPGIFITTNVDECFDDFPPSRIIYKKEHFDNKLDIDTYMLYHIHGSIKDPDSIIFTVPDYIKRYNNSNFIYFMKRNIFSGEYVVLFIGYGLNEFELLDFLIGKFDPDEGIELKHFILLPFYNGEKNILEFEKLYYSSMGIKVLDYEKDELGYGQLYNVIKSWNREIKQTSTYLYDSFKEIDEIIDNYEK